MRRAVGRTRLWAAALLLGGCLKAPPIPMAFLADPLPSAAKAKCLLVLLPGARDHAGAFRDEHFIEDIRASGLSVDVVAADATMDYYLASIAAERLESDVIGPARSKGYAQVWLLGISMGGFGTFNYTQSYPAHVDGIVAFAPYLGDELALKPLRDAGGLAKWTAPAIEPVTVTNHAAQMWGYLQRLTSGETPAPQIYLGCGDTDRMSEGVAMLAARLPKDHVLATSGGHTWEPWRVMLKQFLRASVFTDRCSP